MSVAAAGARISASLSEASFEASRIGSVRLSYRFSKRSEHFRYRLSLQEGGRWQTINRVKKTGRFRGSHTLSVKKLFAGQPVEAGRYRIKLTADAGSTTLVFTVLGQSNPVVKPQAGQWESSALSGPVSGGGLTVTSLQFTVGSDQSSVSGVGFGYTVDWYGCTGGFSGMMSDNAAPITNGQFEPISPTGPWSGPVGGTLRGVFDSSTSAHGTGTMRGSMWCKGPTGFNMLMSGSTGEFSWTATKR